MLNAHVFDDLDQVRQITADWLIKFALGLRLPARSKRHQETWDV
jgi:hypothetical protein